MHLTSIRYAETIDGPWKSALYAGSLSSLTDDLECIEQLSGVPGGGVFEIYEDSHVRRQEMCAIKLPTGRVFDIEQGSYIEEEKAHA